MQLALFARLSASDVTEVPALLTRVGLGDAMDRRAADMSNGMQQRVGMARAFSLRYSRASLSPFSHRMRSTAPSASNTEMSVSPTAPVAFMHPQSIRSR